MPEPFAPDLSSRHFSMTLERPMKAAASTIYDAWTQSFDKWFVALETLDDALRK